MRAVFLGGGALSSMTARVLLSRGHEVIIIEQDKDRIDVLSDEFACGFIHGDGSKPAILRETDPRDVDFLFCLTSNDQINIIASLVGRSLGFKRVITKIEDPEFEHICVELGLKDTIVPDQTIGRYLGDMVEGHNLLDLSAMIKDEARVFSFVVHPESEKLIDSLELPDQCRIICLYRNGKFKIPEPGFDFKTNDEVVMLTHSRNLGWLNDRFAGQMEGEGGR